MSENKPRILIATGIYPPDIGGPATYSKLLFAELPKRGFEVKILSFGEVRHFPKIIRHFSYFFKVLKQSRWADIIYAQDPVSVGLPAMLANFFLRKKFILKIVGDYAWEQGSQRFGVADRLDDFVSKKKSYCWPVLILKKIQTWVARRAEKIIVPSNYLKQVVVQWGISPNKIRVIYNAFNSPAINEPAEQLKVELNLSGRTIISVGRLVPWKGFVTLIELMPEILKIFPGTQLLIAGSGPDRDFLQSKTNELGLGQNIRLLGQLEHSLLLKYIKASDLFVLNTSYEGFSHQLLEVMALGRPIITTRVGGNPELIDSEKNGILVDFNDREALIENIKKVFTEPDWTNHMVNNAKGRVAQFSVENMIAGLVKELV